MRILKLTIKDFRGVRFDQDFEKLGNVIILSGRNGTGKTTVLEAIDILLGKAVGQIQPHDAQAVSGDYGELFIEIELSKEDIKYLRAAIKSLSANEHVSQIDFDEFENSFFPNGKFKRRLEIGAYVSGWTRNNIREFINDEGDEREWPGHVDTHVFAHLSRYFARLDNINAGEVSFLNTQSDYARVVSTRVVGERKTTSSVNLNEFITTPLNQHILSTKIASMLPMIKDQVDFLDSVLESTNLTFDEKHFRDTGRILFQLSSGGRSFPLSQASAGQKQAIALLALLKSWSESKSKRVLLLDEPDLGMHPRMIQLVANKFSDVFDGVSATCIIATHSTDLIKSYGENVFRVTKDNVGTVEIEKVEKLSDRVKLLQDIGAEFDLDYLVKRVIFVESETPRSNKKGLADEDIYQILVDSDKKHLLFKSGLKNQGGKSQLGKRREVWNAVIGAITESDSFNAWTLKDRDDGNYTQFSDIPDVNTPYRNVEYFFVVIPANIAEVLHEKFEIEMTQDEINQYFMAKDNQYDKNRLDVDCKEVWSAFLDKLRQDHGFDEENISSLELAIIRNLKGKYMESIDEEVRVFIDRFDR